MQIVIAVVALFGAAGTIVFLSSLDMNDGFKAVLAAVLVLLAVYSMARVQTKETTAEKDTEE